MIKPIPGIALLLMLVTLISSCASVKPLQYMQGSFDTAKLSSYNIPQPVIQQGDLLSIVVYSDNPAATAIYNQSVITTASAGAANTGTSTGLANAPTSTGYLVDEHGNIIFQGIGNLHIEGLSKAALADTLTARLKPYLTNVYFNIRFLNFKITLIGDVARPSVFSIPSEKINILEALGLAGDLNITARRDNILIIREQNGKRSWGRIDLTKPDIFNSPFYQLQQNDVVYIDLTKNKAAANDVVIVRNISIATVIASTLAIIYSILKK
jgi:polysaccharide biosynthesis/export protein